MLRMCPWYEIYSINLWLKISEWDNMVQTCQNCISSVPKMLYDPLNSTKPNTTLKHYLLSKYFIWERPRPHLMTSCLNLNYVSWVEIDQYMRTLWYNLFNNKNEADTRWVCRCCIKLLYGLDLIPWYLGGPKHIHHTVCLTFPVNSEFLIHTNIIVLFKHTPSRKTLCFI